MDPTVFSTIIGGIVGIVIAWVLTVIYALYERRRHKRFLLAWWEEQAKKYERKP